MSTVKKSQITLVLISSHIGNCEHTEQIKTWKQFPSLNLQETYIERVQNISTVNF